MEVALTVIVFIYWLVSHIMLFNWYIRGTIDTFKNIKSGEKDKFFMDKIIGCFVVVFWPIFIFSNYGRNILKHIWLTGRVPETQKSSENT